MSAFGDSSNEVVIELSAQDNASAEIEQATKKINRQWVNMRNQQRAVERQFELNNRGFIRATRILGTLTNTINRVRSVYNTFLLMQIRQGQVTQRITDLQRDANRAFIEFGAQSPEFIEAQRLANEAVTQGAKGWQDYAVELGLVGLTIAQLITSIPKLVTQIKKLPSPNTPAPTPSKAPAGSKPQTGAQAKPSGGGGIGRIGGVLRNLAKGAGAGLIFGGFGDIGGVPNPFNAVGEAFTNEALDLVNGIGSLLGLNERDDNIGNRQGQQGTSVNITINASTDQEILDAIKASGQQVTSYGTA